MGRKMEAKRATRIKESIEKNKKKQNALKTGGGIREKKEKRRTFKSKSFVK